MKSSEDLNEKDPITLDQIFKLRQQRLKQIGIRDDANTDEFYDKESYVKIAINLDSLEIGSILTAIN